MSRQNLNNRQKISIEFANQEIWLLPSGCAYWPARATLIVSDLHLEKGSYFAKRGNPLPLLDTRDTLQRLQAEIIFLKPKNVICLGDNFHDADAFLRMHSDDATLLDSLIQQVEEWYWIIGNHDQSDATNSNLHTDMRIENILFTHEFNANTQYQIIGHYHPKIVLYKHGLRIQGKCFLVTEETLIMPAFGSYTGGLDIQNEVYNAILKTKPQCYLLTDNTIWLAN